MELENAIELLAQLPEDGLEQVKRLIQLQAEEKRLRKSLARRMQRSRLTLLPPANLRPAVELPRG